MIDIHTHRSADGLLSVEAAELIDIPEDSGRLYSVGFHPWKLPAAGPGPEDWELFERIVSRHDVIAVGECGLDLLKGPPLAIQMNVFRRQAETAERVGKPVIIHCVKAYEQIIGIKKSLRPKVNWGIHGFRGKATVAGMLVSAGFWISVGERFNPAALGAVPIDRLLVETDESETAVEVIIGNIAQAIGIEEKELSEILSVNVTRFLGRDGIVA